MRTSLVYKISNPQGEYVAATKNAEEAAVLVSALGDGAVIRWDHRWIVWREGREGLPAAESYDNAAAIMLDRVLQKQRAAYARSRRGRRDRPSNTSP